MRAHWKWMDPRAEPARPDEDWLTFGEQSSSLVATYPEFRSFVRPDETRGRIRYLGTPGAWIAATEPFAAREERAEWFLEFARQARASGRRAYLVPTGRELAVTLRQAGCSAISIGQEPVFELERYFAGVDPLLFLPAAKRLKARGLAIERVQEISGELRAEVLSMLDEWTQAKGAREARFLSQVDPFKGSPFKRFFVAREAGRAVAIVAVVPIPSGQGCYCTDLLRSPGARHGTTELLLVETMRTLRTEGVREVRLGNCLFHQMAPLEGGGLRERAAEALGRLFFRFGSGIYPARDIARYKKKLRPTRWEDAFLVSAQPMGWRLLKDFADAHFPARFSVRQALGRAVKDTVRLAPIGSIRHPGALTFAFASLFALLHAWRELSVAGSQAFALAGYATAAPTLAGWLAGPFFHDHLRHLVGDVICFVALGWVVETLYSRALFLGLTAVGFWASNPVTALLLAPILAVRPELDYGSSNAVYAYAGAIAASLQAPRWLVAPFLFNGILVCLQKQSWLAMHHWIALGIGYVIGMLWLKLKDPA
ncbi:MAG TPA: phosphatidylglycerol lysyltransferase domain-containing protein [Bdellovibrionota bacterium]|nr:phosphatidylglycerol lysyltransferase domain-containing protein [Bdellovibrionota bacterium]